MRADRLIVERGLARSRALARELIEAGAVSAHDGAGRPIVLKPATELADGVDLRIDDTEHTAYVSRGGRKLAGALRATGCSPARWRCLDAGQSTGGFTDCLLQHGADFVCGIDVGHRQIDPTIRDDPRVQVLERINIRDLTRERLLGLCARSAGGFDLIVADLSFISLRLVLPALTRLADERTRLLALVKPQFEAGRKALDSRGIVRSDAVIARVRAEITGHTIACGWQTPDWIASPIDGGDGNREYFIHARRNPTPGPSRHDENPGAPA